MQQTILDRVPIRNNSNRVCISIEIARPFASTLNEPNRQPLLALGL